MHRMLRVVLRSSAAAALLGMVSGGLEGQVAAQSAEDSVSVAWTAWQLAKGDRPFGHPAGTATVVCLRVSSAAGIDIAEAGEIGVASRLIDALGDSIVRRGDTMLSADCGAEARPTFGTWMLANGEPAVLVTIRQLTIDSPVRARVKVEIVSGGRHARGLLCDFEREQRGAPWTGGCTVEWVA